MMKLYSVSVERAGGNGHKEKYRKKHITIQELILSYSALSRRAGPDNLQRNA